MTIKREAPADYWNHNTAYHPWIIRIAARHGGEVLDVGCGDGFLLQRLAPVSNTVTGIEPDHHSINRAADRLTSVQNVALVHADFDQFQARPSSLDVVTFVATLHHMDMHTALVKARDLLRPGGDLLVVGVAVNTTPLDWAVAALSAPFARVGSVLHREQPDIGVPISAPDHSLHAIRQTASELLPGFRLRRGLYYRYLLRWTNRP